MFAVAYVYTATIRSQYWASHILLLHEDFRYVREYKNSAWSVLIFLKSHSLTRGRATQVSLTPLSSNKWNALHIYLRMKMDLVFFFNFGKLFCNILIEYRVYENYFSRRWQRCKRNVCKTPAVERKLKSVITFADFTKQSNIANGLHFLYWNSNIII